MTSKQKSKTGVLYSLIVFVIVSCAVSVVFGDRFGKVLGRNSDDDRGGQENRPRGDSKDDESDNYNDKRPGDRPLFKPALNEYMVPMPKGIAAPTELSPIVPTVAMDKQGEKVESDESNVSDTKDVYTEPTKVESDEVEVVSVSERSVVSNSSSSYNAPVAVPTKSIFKKIESKIKNVGGSGQFLSKPKTVATPTPVKKDDDFTPPVALGPDSSIFYMVTDTDLLLGAVDKEDKRINVDEAELRGAEITMNKVLAKNGLELGVSSGGSLVLTENGVRSYFDLPVFVDVFSHEISVDTSNGKKQIKTTPAKAVVNAIESGYLESVDKKAQMVMGTINRGELAYRLEGDKEFKVLGRFNLKGAQYVYVDVETGEVSEGEQPLLSRFLKLISL